MPHNLANLCGLVQQRAVKHGMSLDEVWKLVFLAIRDGKLDFEFPSESPHRRLKDRIPLAVLWTPDVVPTTEIEMRCNDALRAIENRDAFFPWTQSWVRDMLVSAAAFDSLLEGQPPVGLGQISRHGSSRPIPTVTNSSSPPMPTVTKSRYRHPSDEALVREGLEAISTGRASNALQAAKLVYSRAEGTSDLQKLDRLRKLISKQIAKDRQS
jgi:hypothetical protein